MIKIVDKGYQESFEKYIGDLYKKRIDELVKMPKVKRFEITIFSDKK